MNLAVIFTTGHADTLGNACRLEMIAFLNRHFTTTVYTNVPEFLEKHLPDAEIRSIGNVLTITTPTGKNSAASNAFADNQGAGNPSAVNLSGRTISGSNSLFRQLTSFRKLAAIINRSAADALFMFHDTSAVALWMKKPVFQYVHQYGRRTRQNGSFLRRQLRNASALIRERWTLGGMARSKMNFVVSEPISDLLRNRGVGKLHTTPHALDLSKFREPLETALHSPLKSLKKQGFFVASYTGWMMESRGFHLMLEALRMAVQRDGKIVLALAGTDAVHAEKLRDFAEKHGLQEHIVDFGIVDSSLTPGILANSDLCLSYLDDLPAFHLSPPQKIIEYFASGKAVICNRIQTHNLVKNGYNGLVTEYDPGQLAESILTLKNDPDLLAELSANALKSASQFDAETLYGELVQIMKSAVTPREKTA